MKTKDYTDSQANVAIREEVDQRLESLRQARQSWYTHWQDIAEYMLPRRYKWLLTPNQANRGSMINQKIIDSTVIKCVRDLTAGLMASLVSPARVWFELSLMDKDLAGRSDVKLWLAECRKRMLAVMGAGNFYPSIQTLLGDCAVFGTAPIIIYKDYDDVIRCYTPCAGEYFVSNNHKYEVDTLYREFAMTVKECVSKFGYESCSPNTKTIYDNNNISQEIIICHAIERDPDYIEERADQPGKGFPYREIYWEKGSGQECILLQKIFNEQPFAVARWDLCSNDPYGRSPGMDALGDVKQLYTEQMNKAEGIAKQVNPPMLASLNMRNQPASLLPRGITYLPGSFENEGFKSAYDVTINLADIKEDIAEVQNRIKALFFNDLFLIVSQLDSQAQPRTATEINQRKAEQLLMLGPMVERFESEVLNNCIGRVFAIMYRSKLFPPAPEGVAGAAIDVDYISMFSEAQKAVGTTGIEQLVSFLGNMAQLNPEVIDILDFDETGVEYGDMLAVSPKLFKDPAAVAAVRQQRAQAQQQQQGMEQAGQGAQIAQNLNKVDVGGGQTAIQAMLQGVGGQQ